MRKVTLFSVPVILRQLIKRCLFFLLSVFSFCSAFAQEKLGIANSNYSSTNSIYLNPASSVDSRTFIQLNLIGANVYAMTNQAYLPSFSVWQAKKGIIEQPVIKTTRTKKFGFANVSVDAPALIVSTGEIGVGFFTRLRAEGDIRRVPYELSSLLSQGSFGITVPTKVDINLRNVKASAMAWAEYGLNFGKMIRKSRDVIISLGGNAKYLTGINISYANLQRFDAHIDFTRVDLNKLKGKVRFSMPGWKTGKGFGVDIGITYKKMLDPIDGYFANSKKSGCKHIDYRYKIGLSLLDLGYIRFTGNTLKGNIEGNLHVGNYQTASPKAIKKQFNASLQENSPILAALPTGLSAQADWNLNHHFYLNGTIIKNIVPTSFTGVQRANLISITPRYEIKQVEVALPLTFEHFIYPQLGFAFRVRTFVLGFDNVLPLIVKANMNVLNVYFNIGISMFKNPSCRQKKSFKLPRRKKPKKERTKIKRKSHFPKGEEKNKNNNTVDCPKGLTPDMIDPKEKEKEKEKKKEEKKKQKMRFDWLKKK